MPRQKRGIVINKNTLASRIFYTECPSCSSSAITKCLTAVDHTVSKQSFEIWHCGTCSLRFTQNVPTPDTIGQYYQSENYISHSDTHKGFINRLYQVVRRYTLKSKRAMVNEFTNVENGNLLDVGAGTGAIDRTARPENRAPLFSAGYVRR